MANEAIRVEGDYEVHDFTVADGTAIDQYTLCQLSDPRTASASSGANVFAGIAASDKEANDGQTNLGLYTKGIFVLTANSTIAVGARVMLSAVANKIMTADAAGIAAGKDFGIALEAMTAGTTGEVKVLR